MSVTLQMRLEGEVQLALVDAWEALHEAVSRSQEAAFGRTVLRRQWVARVKALRGCVLLAAGRLIDLQALERIPRVGGGRVVVPEFKSRRSYRKGESSVIRPGVGGEVRKYALLCPEGFPEMRFGLGRLAEWIEAGEVELIPFFGVGPKPGRAAALAREAERERRGRVLEALGAHQALLDLCEESAKRRAARDPHGVEALRAVIDARRGGTL